MLICIPNVLTKEQVRALPAGSWMRPSGWTAGAPRDRSRARSSTTTSCPRARRRQEQLGELVLEALSRSPLFISAAVPLRIFPPLFNRYGTGQYFGTHVDGAIRAIPGTPVRIRTDLSVTLFLAEPDEYDGGELTVEDKYGAHEVKLPAGDLVLYPSTSLHHVKPVTRGIRVASFFWLQSMVREDSARALLFDSTRPSRSFRPSGASRMPPASA